MTTEVQKSRNRAVIRQNNLCFYCRLPMWNGEDDSLSDFCEVYKFSTRQAVRLRCTAEHLRAIQDGGKTTAANIVAACDTCNKRRHARHGRLSWTDYKAFVEKRVAAGRWHHASFYKVLGSGPSIRAVKIATPPSRHSAASPSR
jgi:HNH endonuclease